jgi:hypothetical protein
MMLLTSASCKKTSTQQQLPPETHEGKFTFGCKVDGKIYTASGKGGILSFDHVYFNLIPADSSVNIGAGTTSSTKNRFNVFFNIKYLGKTGSYLMKTFPYEGKFYDNSNGTIPGFSNTYTTTDNYLGKIEIKYFDGSSIPFNKGTVLAGTFEMEGINGDGKVIHITEGRFDIGQ